MDSDTYASPHLSIWQITIVSQSDLGWLSHKGERTEAHAFSVGLLCTQGGPVLDLSLGIPRHSLSTLSVRYTEQ